MSKHLNHSCLSRKCLKCLFAVFKRSESWLRWICNPAFPRRRLEAELEKTWCTKTQVGPGFMDSNDPRQEPQGWAPGVAWPSWILGFCCYWYLFRKDCEKGMLSVVGFTWISVVQLNLQTQRTCISWFDFFPRLFLTRSYRKGFERWEASGPGCAGLRFGKSKRSKKHVLNGFPFEPQQIGETWSILDTQLIPTPSCIWNPNIFSGCKLRQMVCSQALGRLKGW